MAAASLFDELFGIFGGGGSSKVPEIEVAVGALLVQAAQMDDRFDPSERTTIRRLLTENFKLDQVQLAHLMAGAEAAAARSPDLFHFTHVIVETFGVAERVRLIEMLWEVAYADGRLDPEEDMLIRRIAGLIHVEDHERGEARLRVLDRFAALGRPIEREKE